MLSVNHGTNGIAKIAQQMPSVGDLNSIGCPLAYSVWISAGAVYGDDLDTGTLAQPLSQSRSLAIGQKIDHRIALQIDQDRPIAAGPTP